MSPKERLEVLFEELSELAGQCNAIDGRIVEIVHEIDRDGLCGMTGARSVAALVAWKLGLSSTNAKTIATVAGRLEEFPRCVAGMSEGRLSLDDTVEKWLPGLVPKGNQISLRMLLRHTSGLFDYLNDGDSNFALPY